MTPCSEEDTCQTAFFFFFFFKCIYLFIFGCVRSSLLHTGFLWLKRVGATLRCGAQASHCSGFSCCRAWALGTRASVVMAHGLSSCGLRALERRLVVAHGLRCSTACEIFPDEGSNPCPLHCQVDSFFFLNFILFIYFYSRFLLVINFIHISVYMSISIVKFIPPPHPAAFPPWCPYICSLHLCLNFRPANRFICTIFLGSTYMR